MTTDDLRGVPAVEFIAAEYGITPDQVRRTTTDGLRTRAREAAYEQCANDEQGDAFIDGALWHAAQQPSLPHRDELAAVILDATVPFRGPGGQTVPYVQPVHYAVADAVLALFDGAGS